MNENYHHKINKLIRLLHKEQIPPRSGIFLAMMLACRSHCRCKMESHLVAPKATPLLTSWLNTWCTGLSSTSACSTHITCVKMEQELLTKILKELGGQKYFELLNRHLAFIVEISTSFELHMMLPHKVIELCRCSKPNLFSCWWNEKSFSNQKKK